MMGRRIVLRGGACFALVATLSVTALAQKAPVYKVDASWPKLPLPNHWALASIGGVYADAKDHIWIVHSPQLLANNIKGAVANPKRGECCVPAPAVLASAPAVLETIMAIQ